MTVLKYALLLSTVIAGTAHATPRVSVQVDSTRPYDKGADTGPIAYEELRGTIVGEVDPADPHNAIIQDLALAPKQANGLVRYDADFILLKPRDVTKSNGVLQYNTPNRGNLIHYPPDPAMLRKGEAILYVAWQGDVPKTSADHMTIKVPVAHNPDGSTITGLYRADLLPISRLPDLSLPEVPPEHIWDVSLPGGMFNFAQEPIPPASLDNGGPQYQLNMRIAYSDARIHIPNGDWKFAACDDKHPFPGVPDPARICVKGGFNPKYFYELIYLAKDPKVMGLGLAAIRDSVSFFKNETVDRAGKPNPLAGRIRYAIGSGRSQTGNVMKTFVHLGFNQDIDDRRVFDGIYSIVGARLTNVNARFSVPGGGGGARTDFSAPGQVGPRGLAADYYDAVADRTGGVLARCTKTDTCPKMFLSWTSSEFWALQGSPGLTDAYGEKDLVQPDNVRIYLHSSTQHKDAEAIRYNAAEAIYPVGSGATYIDSQQRALFQDLEEWVVNNRRPPDSRIPTIAAGTLVRPETLKFPAMRGVVWHQDGKDIAIPDFHYKGIYVQRPLLEFGPEYNEADETGIMTYLPPHYLGRDYAILVPQVDADGQDVAGIRGVDVQAPLGTNLGFNYAPTANYEDLDSLNGAFIPFHKTKAERLAAGDERLSLEERYHDNAGYVAAVTAAARTLVKQRFMLQEDADRYIARAKKANILP
ncbi:alpha/beta hydrolase domain-containing protein [Novosphingobium sp. BL-52-GroH]|uniref:alpha/beta hydrolase domain-containing protein n=1 Tax=Novosphingobium sp. BL-52-GroH TaxID=3349877 RepID=UPI00384F09E0